jgi:outer membrane protein assembly factor BamD (BamD/ComL family)/predicted Ser/Thr protein kinase
MIGRTVAHYRILEQLGAGGMGVVYKAEDLRLGRAVALKFLPVEMSRDNAAVERFEREARTASSLNHPNICTIFAIDEFEGQRFIAMELLDGHSLSSTIGGRPLPIDRILELGIQIADALDAAHSQNILHRDIKPANIFVTRRHQAKVLDFGLAKLAAAPAGFNDTGEDSPTMAGLLLSTQGIALGTVAYMSPEQARGEVLDARSDLFSFGIVLYEMATGVQAFPGQTSAVVFDSILNRMPAPISSVRPDIPVQLDQIITKALEKDRALRYQTASDMHADLRRLKRDRDSGRMPVSGAVPISGSVPAASGAAPAAASSASAPVPVPAPARKRRTGILVGGALLVLVVGGAVAALALRGSGLGGADSAALLPEPPPAPEAALENPAPIDLVDPNLNLPDAEAGGAAAPVDPKGSPAVPSSPAGSVRTSERAARRGAAESTAPASTPAVEEAIAPELPASSPVRTDPGIALLSVAQAKAAAKLFDQAATDLQAIVRDHPSSDAAPAALITLAGIRQQQARAEDALAAYVEVRSRYRGSPEAAEAGVRYAQLLLRSNRPDRVRVARDTYAAVARDYPNTVWAPRALSSKADLEAREKLKESDTQAGGVVPAALVTWRDLAERHPDSPETESALWNLANGYEDLRRYEFAAQTFELLGTRFPKTGHDAWWKAGEIYDKRLRNPEAAKNAYGRVPATSRNYREAQKRIK